MYILRFRQSQASWFPVVLIERPLIAEITYCVFKGQFVSPLVLQLTFPFRRLEAGPHSIQSNWRNHMMWIKHVKLAGKTNYKILHRH